MIGDSFSGFIRREADYYFTGGTRLAMVTEYNFDFKQAMDTMLPISNANLVVWECAERYIERLK